MGDDTATPLGPPDPGGAPVRRWLRWGKVYVDIEPPHGPNPWTSPSHGSPVLEAPVLPVPPGRRWRPALVVAAAAIVGALLAALVVLAFGRHDGRRPTLAPASATTTRPTAPARPTTSAVPRSPVTGPPSSVSRPGASNAVPPPARSTAPTTATPGATIVPTTTPGGTSAATTAGGRSGTGPITVPEGVDPAATAPPATTAPAAPTTAPAPRTAPATTTTVAGPQAFLGVTVQDSVDGPSVVEVIAGTGAERAGILPGDVITAVDTTTFDNVDDLGATIRSHKPGDTVTVTMLRNGATVTATATLGERI